jgi:rare lipoprotein A
MAMVVNMVRRIPKHVAALAVVSLVIATLSACGTASPVRESSGYRATGLASYYGKKFHGRRTASGERYNMNALTAAHRSLKFGSRVKVTNLKTKRSVVVRVNDRGPFVRGRIIDLSWAAAKRIGMIGDGVVRVKVRSVD